MGGGTQQAAKPATILRESIHQVEKNPLVFPAVLFATAAARVEAFNGEIALRLALGPRNETPNEHDGAQPPKIASANVRTPPASK